MKDIPDSLLTAARKVLATPPSTEAIAEAQADQARRAAHAAKWFPSKKSA